MPLGTETANGPAAPPGVTTLPLKYWAFITYSHHDATWAEWLHEAIETYRVPPALVGRTTPHGLVPPRLVPVFRDRDELPSSSELHDEIKEALAETRCLIVVCSPWAVASHWVDVEIRTFKTLRPGNQDEVLCLIVDGEPHVDDGHGGASLECFPAAVRYQVDAAGNLTDRQIEPGAADARPGKDGKDGALLRLLSGILGVGFDELRQRERTRQRRQRLRRILVGVGVAVLGVLVYLAAADEGLVLPGSRSVRDQLDRRHATVFRRAYGIPEISRAAEEQRSWLRAAIEHARGSGPWFARSFSSMGGWPNQGEVWVHSQSVAAILADPGLSRDEFRPLVPSLVLPFRDGLLVEARGILFGWPLGPEDDHTFAGSALWTAEALALALTRPDLLDERERADVAADLAKTQAVLGTFGAREAGGGWAMFPLQEFPQYADPYSTVLALTALLETRRAGLPWDGSLERRDQLLAANAGWLIDHFDAENETPGWGFRFTKSRVLDGLTLQIFSVLLRAESEAGTKLPRPILEAIPAHLLRCADRSVEYPSETGEVNGAAFIDDKGRSSSAFITLKFAWYPWAVETAARWLARSRVHPRLPQETYGVQRTLGHLVVDLGWPAITETVSGRTFFAAEQLYCLSAVRLLVPGSHAEP
jgi:hypothetical protein